MYILLKNNIVSEFIPDIDPVFPGVPIEERYAAEFIAQMIHVDDGTEVGEGQIYDPETGMFTIQPQPEIIAPEPEQEETIGTAELTSAYTEGVNSIDE